MFIKGATQLLVVFKGFVRVDEKKMKTTPCNEKKHYAFDSAPRCGAKTRQGLTCRSPAVKNRSRCRLHGCGKGSGAPKGNKYAVTHGQSTSDVKRFKKEVRELLQKAREW